MIKDDIEINDTFIVHDHEGQRLHQKNLEAKGHEFPICSSLFILNMHARNIKVEKHILYYEFEKCNKGSIWATSISCGLAHVTLVT